MCCVISQSGRQSGKFKVSGKVTRGRQKDLPRFIDENSLLPLLHWVHQPLCSSLISLLPKHVRPSKKTFAALGGTTKVVDEWEGKRERREGPTNSFLRSGGHSCKRRRRKKKHRVSDFPFVQPPLFFARPFLSLALGVHCAKVPPLHLPRITPLLLLPFFAWQVLPPPFLLYIYGWPVEDWWATSIFRRSPPSLSLLPSDTRDL